MSNLSDFQKLLDDIKKYPSELRQEQAIAIINESKVKTLMLIDALKDLVHDLDTLDTARTQIERGFYFMRMAVIGDE